MSISIVKRGGARPGAGRKRTGKVYVHVFIRPESVTVLKELGGGDEISPGIDMAAARVGRLKPIGTMADGKVELNPGIEAWADQIAVWAELPEEQQP